jgi:two-component system sensor histidine kinase/response regulator
VATAKPQIFEDRYRSEVRRYLDGIADESSLLSALDVGRLAVTEERGILDVVAEHDSVLAAWLTKAATGDEASKLLDRAHEFLVQALMPFEMTHRSWRATVERMTELNATLEARVASQVAALKATDAELRRSQEHLARAQRVGLTGSSEFDIRARTTVWSDELYRILGLDPGKVSPSLDSYLAVIPPEDHDRERQIERKMQLGLLIEPLEFRIVRLDGIERWLLRTTEVVRDDDGAPTYLICTYQDVSERKRAEIELDQYRHHLEELVDQRTVELSAANNRAEMANRAKSAFLSSMSHEIRTPLNAIIGYSEMMLEELKATSEEQLAGDAERILNAGRHLLALINDILDLSKIEAGKMTLFVEDLVIRDLIEDVRSTAQGLVEQNGNTLVIDIDSGLPETVRNDAVRVRQVLLNLVSNAAKFTKEGVVTISAGTETVQGNRQLRLAVADTGIGMEPNQLERLFNEFTQVDNAATRRAGGTGLGLSICRHIARMMGGGIEVTSVVGQGSTFTMLVPLSVEGGSSQ